jgi:hypothetical protein
MISFPQFPQNDEIYKKNKLEHVQALHFKPSFPIIKDNKKKDRAGQGRGTVSRFEVKVAVL